MSRKETQVGDNGRGFLFIKREKWRDIQAEYQGARYMDIFWAILILFVNEKKFFFYSLYCLRRYWENEFISDKPRTSSSSNGYLTTLTSS